MRCGDFRTSYAADTTIFESSYSRNAVIAFPGRAHPGASVRLAVRARRAEPLAIAAIAAIGLNMLTGFTGRDLPRERRLPGGRRVRHRALAGKLGLPFLMAIPLSGVVGGAAGMVFGIPSPAAEGALPRHGHAGRPLHRRVHRHHWDAVTGGVNGISVPAASLGSFAFDSDARLFYLVLPLTAFLTLFATNLFRTRVGKAFIAIRDQDISAEVMGVRVFRYKLLAFGVSSFYVGVAGSLLAYQARIISPENFPISLAIDQLGMVIIGGLGSVQGSISAPSS